MLKTYNQLTPRWKRGGEGIYYKGASYLRQGIGINPQVPYHTADRRWTNFAKHLGILDVNGNWLPDHLTAQWTDLRNFYLNTMWLFAEFWYNRLTHDYLAGPRVAFDINILYIYRFILTLEDDVNKLFDFDDFNANPSPDDYIISNKTDYQIMKENVEYCFNSKFLIFLKTKCQEEGTVI